MWGAQPNLQTVDTEATAGEQGQRAPLPSTLVSTQPESSADPRPDGRSVPVGGLQEEGPFVHLLGHVHIVLAPDGHGVGLPQQVVNVVVHVVRVLTQPGKVVDLRGGVEAGGP